MRAQIVRGFVLGLIAATAGSAHAASSGGAPLATPPGVTLQSVNRNVAGAQMGAGTLLQNASQRNYNFTDAAGMTLYTYEKDRDAPGKSACTGACAALWPPLIAPAREKRDGVLWTTITRDDGQKQWAMKGKPVYRYSKDTAIGQETGRGLEDGSWQAARFDAIYNFEIPAGMRVEEIPDAAGQALVSALGRVVYAYDGGVRDMPKCGDIPCKWEPVPAPQLATPIGAFAIVTRPDLTRQWTYKGKPLFTYSGDFESGYAAGMGIDKKMNVAVLLRFFMPPAVTLQNNASQGYVLANAQGRTLYRRDTWVFQQGGHGIRRGVPPRPAVGRAVGTSMEGCDEGCQKVWKPFLANADAQASGFWTIAARSDGTRQWAYKGYALYTYDGDKKPGDLLGNDYYDFILSLDPKKETVYPNATFGMGGLAWLYAFP